MQRRADGDDTPQYMHDSAKRDLIRALELPTKYFEEIGQSCDRRLPIKK
jgi:hypothetical protein